MKNLEWGGWHWLHGSFVFVMHSAFPSRLQNSCCSSRHYIWVKGTKKWGRERACTFTFCSGKQLSLKVSSRFLLRSDQLELSQTPLALEGLGEQVEGSGDEGIGPLVSPRCLPHPVSTPSCVYPILCLPHLPHFTVASFMSFLFDWMASPLHLPLCA